MSTSRRGFLTTIAAAFVGAVVAPMLPSVPTPIFTELVEAGPVGDFVAYYYWQGELICESPRQSAMISNICE
jgi:hypothetical protein